MSRYDDIFSENWAIFDKITFPEILYHVHIAWQSRIVYIETPKAGVSTLKRILIQYEWRSYANLSFDTLHDRRFSPLLNILQVPSFPDLLKDNSFLKICTVRNPVTRLLSAYLDQITKKDPDRIANISPFIDTHRHDMWSDIPFSTFVDGVCRQPVGMMDMHWRVQYHQNLFPHITYDYVGHTEYIEGLFSFLEMHRPGIAKYFEDFSPHATGSSGKIGRYYTDEILAKVYDKFDIDFKTFHYEKKPPEW